MNALPIWPHLICKKMPESGFEPLAQRFSVFCSTPELLEQPFYTKTHTAISWDKINKGLGKINNKTRKNNEAPINIDLSLSILSTKVQDLEASKYIILINRK